MRKKFLQTFALKPLLYGLCSLVLSGQIMGADGWDDRFERVDYLNREGEEISMVAPKGLASEKYEEYYSWMEECNHKRSNARRSGDWDRKHLTDVEIADFTGIERRYWDCCYSFMDSND